MNILSRDKQIEVIAALAEGMGIRAAARLTGVDRGTVGSLALRVGRGCAELHDRLVVGVRVARIEMDEAWSFVAKKNKRIRRTENAFAIGDQYVWVAMAGTQKAILSFRVGKRDLDNAHAFCDDLREGVLGVPEISSDALHAYGPAIRAAFGERVHYGQITKTVAVTDLRKDAAHRYSPAEVVAVERTPITGIPAQISTSYVERQNLSLRMASRRFTRLTNSFSKKLDNHVAAVSLYVAHYNLCRVHETLRTTPAVALGIADRVWGIGDLLDAALVTQPIDPVVTAPDRRRRFRVIEGGRK
jgi:IS1 family transposase